MDARWKRPQPWRWLALGLLVLGFLFLLAYYEAFGEVIGSSDAFFAIAWVLMPVGLVGVIGTSVWAHRVTGASWPRWAVVGVILFAVAFGIMLLAAAMAAMFAF